MGPLTGSVVQLLSNLYSRTQYETPVLPSTPKRLKRNLRISSSYLLFILKYLNTATFNKQYAFSTTIRLLTYNLKAQKKIQQADSPLMLDRLQDYKMKSFVTKLSNNCSIDHEQPINKHVTGGKCWKNCESPVCTDCSLPGACLSVSCTLWA